MILAYSICSSKEDYLNVVNSAEVPFSNYTVRVSLEDGGGSDLSLGKYINKQPYGYYI